MSNADFWKSINTIIAQGFNFQGLKQLEEYAELFISGRLIYKRFSPLEQYGCATGGSNHVIASILAGASIEPNSLTAPQGSFQREHQCAETQANRIEQWAKIVGCWIDNVDNRISLHNAYFPETRLSVLGFGRTSDGAFQVIVEQPHIQGKQMEDKEIRPN